MRLIYLSLFALTVLFSACDENETAYELPTIPDEFITYTIAGQEITLNAVSSPHDTYFRNTFSSNVNATGDNWLRLHRTSADEETTMTITARDLPLVENGNVFTFNVPGYARAQIQVRSNYMSGSIYCPHPENVTQMTYEALIKVDELTKEGRIKGEFITDPDAAGNAINIEDGRFELVVGME